MPPTPPEPDGAARLPILDALRGVAILGILFMNINDFGGPVFASLAGDVRALGWSGADRVAWWLRETLAQGTARALLEMLFGAGMAILTDRAATAAGEWQLLRAYWTRNLVLVAFGLVLVFVLLWPGDILHTYGLAALIAVLFRRLRPRLLLCLGLSLAALQLVGGGAAALDYAQARADPTAIAAHAQSDRAAQIDLATRQAAEDQARTGNARSWAGAAWDVFAWMQERWLEVAFVWEAAGTMLIGTALFRLGVLTGERATRWYAVAGLSGYAFGLACRIWAASVALSGDAGPSLADATGEFARLAMTLGHLCLIVLLARTAAGARLLRPFEAAGRTALSLYVAQTLICGWLLYPPWGLALYGKQGWAALMTTALAVDAALLALAVRYTRRFRIAPVEWAWRSILARRRLPFRRVDRIGS